MMHEVFKSGVADAKFQTSYVLFVLSSLLCPRTKDVASMKFYPTVYDLTKISSYAWPQFVLDWLVKVIMQFKKRDIKDVDKKKDGPGVSGCVLLLMEAQKAFHTLQKSFLKQMHHIILLDAFLMAHVFETTTHKSKKGKDVREMDSPLDDFACHQFPCTSTSTPKKARKGVGTDGMDEDTITGFQNVHNASDMPLYTPEHLMDDVVHTSIMGHCGRHAGVPIDQHKLNMDEEVQMQQEVMLEMQGKIDGEGEQVQVDEGVIEERALTRPLKKRGNRTGKASKTTRTPYVAEPEVKDLKFTKEELQLIKFVMKPARKKEDMKGIVSMDGMMFNPSRTDLHNVFKERGQMSNLVMDNMIVWLMKEEKRKAPKKNGVHIPTRHMFSSTFVGNLRNIRNLKKQNVVNDRVDPNILGYDVTMCNLTSLTFYLFIF
ncbi:hypothetical protein RHMOL_Rhmol09G0090300 [Rhododendron molle]|uniref:Uncharacterized protein n=1 Tax=Rhododendron molle TaxID=49168 RepID=A0ACC0MD04_RHOML|nr:hypothetical protein RHMOL_Rhmol09G0090300 [Rhododendron molle]